MGNTYSGIRHRCSPSHPCRICGSTDYDMEIEYAPDDVAYWCHKVFDKTIISNGVEYEQVALKEISIGTFSIYRTKASLEKSRKEWVEQQKRDNPDWKGTKTHNNNDHIPTQVCDRKEEIPPIPPLSNSELDVRYRYLLSLLVLEEKHKQRLKEEWSSEVYPTLADSLLKIYPLRSLPPLDSVRYGDGFKEKLRNQSRKKIVAAMVEKFGDLRGIPGFYLRGGEFWNGKEEKDRWTFVSGEGIIFPVYDENGYLYRLRYRDDYHNTKLKESSGKTFNGQTGVFSHSYDKDGNHTWKFFPDGKGEPRVVYGPGVKEIALNKWGVPVLGKAENKYKTLSSVYMKDMGDCIRNSMEGGSPSGSPYSIYIPKGDYSNKVVIATEGEKKGMVTSFVKRVPVISVAGVGTFNALFENRNGEESVIQQLKKKGMKALVLCYDADKSENSMVSRAEKEFLERIKQAEVIPYTGEWSGKFDKGLDDILLMGIDFKIIPYRS